MAAVSREGGFVITSCFYIFQRRKQRRKQRRNEFRELLTVSPFTHSHHRLQAQSWRSRPGCATKPLRVFCIPQDACESSHGTADAPANAAIGGSSDTSVGAAQRRRGLLKPCSTRKVRLDMMQPKRTSCHRYLHCGLRGLTIPDGMLLTIVSGWCRRSRSCQVDCTWLL